MKERQKQHLLDRQEEAHLKALFDEAMEQEGRALLERYEAEKAAGTLPQMPEELDAKYRELIRAFGRKQQKERFLKTAGIWSKRVAVIALVLLCLVSTLIVSVDAIRIPIMNLFVIDEERHSTIFFGEKQPDAEEMPMVEKVLSVRLPSGYELEELHQKENGALSFRFEHNESMIQVNVMPSKVMIDFDTEDAEQVSTEVYDWPAVYIEKNGYRILWYNADLNYAYDVNTTGLSESEFWEYVYRLAE